MSEAIGLDAATRSGRRNGEEPEQPPELLACTAQHARSVADYGFGSFFDRNCFSPVCMITRS
jgi:hypothetical protein